MGFNETAIFFTSSWDFGSEPISLIIEREKLKNNIIFDPPFVS
jgi:hypothetical protein